MKILAYCKTKEPFLNLYCKEENKTIFIEDKDNNFEWFNNENIKKKYTNFGAKQNIEIKLDSILKNKRYIVFYCKANGLFINNIEKNSSYLYELFFENKTAYNNNVVAIEFVVTEDTIYFYSAANIILGNENDIIKYDKNIIDLYSFVKHVSPEKEETAKKLAEEDFAFFRRRNLYPFIRPQNSLAYLDVQADFILLIIKAIIDNDSNLKKHIENQIPEYNIFIKTMLDNSILNLKTVENCLLSLDRKKETRINQEKYYEEVCENEAT